MHHRFNLHLNRLTNHARLRIHTQSSKPAQNDTRMDTTSSRYEFARVLVVRDKQSAARIGLLEHLVVTNAWFHPRNVQNLMPIATKVCDDGAFHAFVSNELHAAWPGDGSTTSAGRARVANTKAASTASHVKRG